MPYPNDIFRTFNIIMALLCHFLLRSHHTFFFQRLQTEKSSGDQDAQSKPSDSDKATEGGDKQGGFFSRIFKWKGSNQAHLPEDKDPSIVWDDNLKRWVNKDGDDEADAPPPPPPMASSLRNQAAPANRQGPRSE